MPKTTIKQSSPPSDAPAKPLEWKAPEYEYRKKSPDWFWMVGIITIALVFSAVLLGNLLLGILTGLAGFSIALYGAKKPPIVNFRVGPRGIQVGDKIYNYENLKSFWIDYDPPRKKELIIESKKTFMPYINIVLGDMNPEKTREYLLQFLREEKIEEPLTITIARLLGF